MVEIALLIVIIAFMLQNRLKYRQDKLDTCIIKYFTLKGLLIKNRELNELCRTKARKGL